MGDTNNYQQGNDVTQQHYAGSGMDAMFSAIEYKGQTSATQAAAACYPMMANMQDHMGASSSLQSEEIEKLRAAHAAVAAGLYPNLPANALTAGVSNPLWGLNPMLMPFLPQTLPGLRPGMSLQPPTNLLPQSGVHGLPHSVHERETAFNPNNPASLLGKKLEGADTGKIPELSGLPFGYSGLQYLHQSGLSGVPGVADKVPPSVHEAAAKGLQYPSPSALSPYLSMQGYQNLLASNAAGILPSVLSGGLNPAALGALGSYPYYQSGLIPRMPYLPPVAPNPMIRMPLSTGLNTPPAQSNTPDGSALRPDSPRADPRPQSGGYLPIKENLQRKISAPNPGSGSQFRLPMRNDVHPSNKPGVSYPAFNHRGHLPSQLIAPTTEPNKHTRPRAAIDPKSIEQRISQLISQNEKILSSPTLDKVKPRRVLRRSSLDPASLSSPNPTHNPLTCAHSAPRSLDPKYSKPLLNDKVTSAERPNFLTVPSRSTDSQNNPQSSRPQMTFIPDPRRDPNARANAYIPGYTAEPRRGRDIVSKDPGQYLVQPEVMRQESFHCVDCGTQFWNRDTYEAHKAMYCAKRPNLASLDASTTRQSVIQYTSIPSTESNSSPQEVPELKVTPPESQGYHPNRGVDDETASRTAKLLENPLRQIHKDLYRAHSADAALPLPRKIIESETLPRRVSPEPRVNLSPPKLDISEPPKVDLHPPSSKSSIPTDKLPPKKKQLQLMRSNSSSKSQMEVTRSPGRGHSPLSTDHTPSPQESKTPEESPKTLTAELTPHKLQPPSSLHLDAAPSRKTFPAWIPLEKEEKGGGVTLEPPPIYFTEPSSQNVAFPVTCSSLLPSPTGKSPTSPKSPSRNGSPVRGSRSPSRSPTSSNLESSVPRSNYKLLLHQISLRNMQDMGYLSEAYHHSKDKNLKRNIASLLWSSVGTHSIEGNSTGSTKRMRPFGSSEGPNMEELYPGKASLARRLSPDSRSARLHESSSLSPMKTPLSQSRSRPYESTLKAHPSLTRSHSSHSHSYSSDVNNNIKQFLQNKSRQQQQAMTSSSQPSKGHKPLTRTNANARYLLKSPTKISGVESPSALAGKSALEARNSLSGGASSFSDGTQGLKESLALKRAASYNPDSMLDYQSKRQKLKPITKQPTTTAHTMLPTSLVAPRLTEHVPTTLEVKELPKIKSVNPHTVQTPFLLHPHWSPSLGYDPHPTFCSLVSPQPMYVELQQSKLSMYSQWAVSEPLLLPDGMTVMDMFQNMRFLKGLSPYISYNSLFTSPSDKEALKLTETKEYESKSKNKDSTSDQKLVEIGSHKSEPMATEEKVADVDVKENEDDGDEVLSKKRWMFSRIISPKLQRTASCFTSCHNKVSAKSSKKSTIISKTLLCGKGSKNDPNNDCNTSPKKVPKLPPPKVIIHPPSPDSSGSDSQGNPQNSSPKNTEITALEFSDCDTDDDVIKGQKDHFLNLDKAPASPSKTSPSSAIPSPFVTSSSKSAPTSEQTQQSPNGMPCNQNLGETANAITSHSEKDSDSKNDLSSDSESQLPLQIDEDDTKMHTQNEDYPSSKIQDAKRPKSVDLNHNIENNTEVKGESSEGDHKKWRKIRKSRKERNANSPLLQKRAEASAESPLGALEDPSLAVHPIGACSDDPAKICALCRMKAEGRKPSDDEHPDDQANDNCNGKGETSKSDDSDSAMKPHSPSHLAERPGTPHTPTIPRVRTPTSGRPRTPVPLTVSVPKRSRDRSSSKSGNQPLTPGILDKARGKGTTTQHWVTTTDLQTSQQSPKQDENGGNEEKTPESQNSEAKNEKSGTKNRSYSSSEYFSTMPPNKNPVLELSLQQKPPETTASTPTVTSANGGLQALAAVVSGVMMSAAIQSKKKTKSSKHEMTELLSHSRPLIPTSELNAPANKVRFSEKLKNSELEGSTDKNSENSLGSLANLTATVGPNAAGSRGKPSLRHLSLSSREKELFLNKANETRMTLLNERKVELDVDGQTFSDIQDIEDGHHSDSAKEDCLDGDGESSNPRPHKCLECKVAFRIAGHLAKHLRSKGHIIAMQKKTLNRLKQQKLSTVAGQESTSGGQGVNISGSVHTSANSPEANQSANQDELLTQLGEGAETLAQAQVRALFEGNDEYAEINTGMEGGLEALPEASDDEGEYAAQCGSSDPRPFKCIACKVAFRFQGHLDRHFRSNTHLLAVGHFGRDATNINTGAPNANMELEEHLSGKSDNIGAQDIDDNNALLMSEHERDASVSSAESSQNRVDAQKDLNLVENSENSYCPDRTDGEISDGTIQKVEENSNQHEDQQSDEAAVIEECNDADWSKRPSITFNNHTNGPKEPLNGLVSHSLPVLSETTKSDSLMQMPIKTPSPVIQSSSKKMFETSPTIPEMPLPSTSPVQKRQQLTC